MELCKFKAISGDQIFIFSLCLLSRVIRLYLRGADYNLLNLSKESSDAYRRWFLIQCEVKQRSVLDRG